MKEAISPRIIAVGSVTGNDNTVGGGGVYPIADLHELEGLQQGMKKVRYFCVAAWVCDSTVIYITFPFRYYSPSRWPTDTASTAPRLTRTANSQS